MTDILNPCAVPPMRLYSVCNISNAQQYGTLVLSHVNTGEIHPVPVCCGYFTSYIIYVRQLDSYSYQVLGTRTGTSTTGSTVPAPEFTIHTHQSVVCPQPTAHCPLPTLVHDECKCVTNSTWVLHRLPCHSVIPSPTSSRFPPCFSTISPFSFV